MDCVYNNMAPYTKDDNCIVQNVLMAYLPMNDVENSVGDPSLEADDIDDAVDINREDTEEEEERLANVFPPPPNALPESLPLENSLPQLLMSQIGVSEEYELTNKKSAKLRIISKEMSLQRLSIYMPMLVELDLSGSWLQSLRDLGGTLKIKVLRVARCGLDCLDGLFGLSLLQELHAQSNVITDVGSCAFLPRLQLLDLSRNLVADIGEISFLGICYELKDLNLSDNPVCDYPQYRAVVRQLLPALEKFDGETLAAESDDLDEEIMEDVEGSSNFDETENVEVVLKEKDIKPLNSRDTELCPNMSLRQRPSTSTGVRQSISQRNQPARPHTAMSTNKKPQNSLVDGVSNDQINDQNSASILTSGGIVCGNLTAALRSRSRRNRKENLWCESSVEFEATIPELSSLDESKQENLEAEINIQDIGSVSNPEGDDRVTEVNDLIEASRKWRIAYTKYREAFREVPPESKNLLKEEGDH